MGLAALVAVILVCVAVTALLYLLFQGKTRDGSAIAQEIQSRLQSFVSEDQVVELGETDLDFTSPGRVVLKSSAIRILDRASGETVSTVGSLEVEGGLIGFLTGNTSFNSLHLSNVELDWNRFGKVAAIPLPPVLRQPLDETGQWLAWMNALFATGDFTEIRVSNSVITGPFLGRRADSMMRVESAVLGQAADDSLSVTANMQTKFSDLRLEGQYRAEQANEVAGTLEFSATGISLREWLPDPYVNEGLLASDANMAVNGILTYDETGKATDPSLRILATDGGLRIGRRSVTQVNSAEINLRLILDRNQIELDPSVLSLGGLNATLIGGLIPKDGDRGYHGPVRYDIIMSRGDVAPTIEGEEPVPAAFKVAGVFDPDVRILAMDRMVMTTRRGFIEGSGSLDFTQGSPAIRASAMTNGISVAALKQFWPFFVAGGAREWVHSHVLGGWVGSGTFHADIPPGVILEIGRGAVLDEDQYRVDLALRDFSFRPMGELHPIEEAVGKVSIRGLSLEGILDEGVVKGADFEQVSASRGRFYMADFSARNRWGEIAIELDGDIRSLGKISQRKPLVLMDRLKVKADQFGGTGHADIAARFPVGRKAAYEEIDWNILFEMRKGSSSRKLAGRELSGADLLIDASPTGARVTGDMRVDGVASRVNLVEPIGKSGKVSRNWEIATVMDEAARKKIGVNLAPIVNGPVKVKIRQDDKSERYFLDFIDASLDIPWVGWSKGNGIAAAAEFVLKRRKNGVVLQDFTLQGEGFHGIGSLAIDKRGLVSANLTNLKLNDFDDIKLKVARDGKTYNINASGLTYDARGLLNTLIHKGGFTKAQGERSVNLVANFGTVIGFGNRAIRNAVLTYESRFGRLNRLELIGEGSGGQRYNIQAQLNGNDTLFNIATNDAGGALGFTNIYTRMEGGNLQANLLQSESGPYVGPVQIRDFTLVNEPRLSRMASSVRRQLHAERGDRAEILPETGDKKVRFLLADARIERGQGYFHVHDAIIRSPTIGLALEGVVYNQRDRMDLTGTYMPAQGLNVAFSSIPLLGELLADGRKNALIGINYRLSGPRDNPDLVINPLSIVTPGVFNRVFEFKR